MNCCGVDGPQDYMHTSWYNHSKDTEGIFVPPSCCVLKNDNPRRPSVANENFCQVDAIFYISPKNNNDTLGYLKTQVRTHLYILILLPIYLVSILFSALSVYLHSYLFL